MTAAQREGGTRRKSGYFKVYRHLKMYALLSEIIIQKTPHDTLCNVVNVAGLKPQRHDADRPDKLICRKVAVQLSS